MPQNVVTRLNQLEAQMNALEPTGQVQTLLNQLTSRLTTIENRVSEYNLGDNCIQNFHLGSYIVGYTVGKLVLWRRASGAVKRDFRTYIRRYTSPNEILNMVIPILMHFCSLSSNWSVASRIKPHVIQRNVT